MKYTAAEEQKLMQAILSPELRKDPLAFVMYVFPWGKEGTPLAKYKGPRKWQREELEQIRLHMEENVRRMARGEDPVMYQLAVASGRGIGKSALVSWIILWALSTAIGCSVVVTANTESQLKDKTWAELGKWHTMALNSHWFDKQALSLRPMKWLADALKKSFIDTGYYYAQAQLWSEENPDAFAGLHNPNGVMLIMDEASGIPKPIWSVSEGFFTEPVLMRFWLVFSNPRQPEGAFFDCFHADKDFWNTVNIDSREVEGTDKAVYQKIIDKYGEDSDEARVEVKGQFPKTGSNQLIGQALLDEASSRTTSEYLNRGLPRILGVDVAREGDDKTVIMRRQGKMTWEPIDFSIPDNMEVAARIANIIEEFKPHAVFIDKGNGAGVIDRLRQLRYKVIEVNFGISAFEPSYKDKRMEMYQTAKEWLEEGGVIPPHERLKSDLMAHRFDYTATTNQKFLIDKKSMKKWYKPSPDYSDALVCTFAYPVAIPEDEDTMQGGQSITDYDPYHIPTGGR